MPTNSSKDRSRKKKSGTPANKMWLYLLVGGGGFVAVVSAVVIAVLLSRNRGPETATPDQSGPVARRDATSPNTTKKAGGDPPPEKYVIPASLPVWAPRPLLDKKVNFDAGSWTPRGKFHVFLPVHETEPQYPDFVKFPNPFNSNLKLCDVNFLETSAKDFGFSAGRRSPKDALSERIRSIHENVKLRTYKFMKIEEGRNQTLAMARVEFTSRDQFSKSDEPGVLYFAMDPPNGLYIECRWYDKGDPVERALEMVALSTRK